MRLHSVAIVLIIRPLLLAILWCRALVVVMHGLNEHRWEPFLFVPVAFEIMIWLCWLVADGWPWPSLDWCGSGRYDHLARRLNEIGIKVYGMDWTGEWFFYPFFLVLMLHTYITIGMCVLIWFYISDHGYIPRFWLWTLLIRAGNNY